MTVDSNARMSAYLDATLSEEETEQFEAFLDEAYWSVELK